MLFLHTHFEKFSGTAKGTMLVAG